MALKRRSGCNCEQDATLDSSSRPRRNGYLVEILGPEIFEVEFSDDSGRTYASLALGSNQLLRLHHEPVDQAA